ncbi:hypothetical protein [Streptomyces sp. MP131-18]|uniref:hypothetical protein n=1 Tax=Streptomyces sp. MP131-18 TaxID=1857892 RepID=UPI0009CAA4FF|nr:hypothetical protein [Streptomyces sp. MP131-18]ONK10403.1 hypothetical protein STBA_11250 [Streptomyces sp. MP131-18]
MNERRMDEGTAALARATAEHARTLLDQWQHEYPNVADYRINDALSGLRLAVKALDHLYRDEQYPEHVAARQALAERLS